MNIVQIADVYNFEGKTALVTGGSGVLGFEIVRCLVGLGANVIVLVHSTEMSIEQQEALDAGPGTCQSLHADVLDRESLVAARQSILERYGRIDTLINAAGGNHPDATTNAERSFFDLPQEALNFTSDLNLLGTILPCQVFGEQMAKQKEGIILNISSMNAFRPLTRIPAYSAAKAAVSNFTQWLAVHMAQEYSPKIRVNAIAPGFFLTRQNRFLLTDETDGGLTERGQKIIDHTPMGRFGDPEDLL
ncbi:MAG: SDR family NAD(P)-dependent oxidoreductase, partial [Anaerolineaceae bacterium]|nr:SDR family NAD(P)-dependent oxidoreductase [Anaerolineaceae bacterium]